MRKITYSTANQFTEEQLEKLFLSVGWESGKHPDKLVRAMKHSYVVSAWDEDRLVGLVRGLDDDSTVAFLHYLLVDPEYQGRHIADTLMHMILDHYREKELLYIKIMPSDPKTIPFYERYGFACYDNYTAMQLNIEYMKE